jgi:hypothetical protein
MEQPIQHSKRARRSKKQILDLLHEFEKSGKTIADYCKLHNISTGNFRKWKSRYKINSTTSNRKYGFAKLNVSASTSSALFAEVNGIRIYQPVSASFLKELL